MEIIKNIDCTILYQSIKDINYSKDINFVYCNFDIEGLDKLLDEWLSLRILDHEGIRISINDVNWNTIDNYYMLITKQYEKSLVFIKDNIISDTKITRLFIEHKIDNIEDILENMFKDKNIEIYL